MKNNIIEGLVALALLALAVVVLNPTGLFMPDMVLSGMLVGLLALFFLLALFVVRERAGDEREAVHRASAGRVAFLVGGLVLVAGIVAEGRVHSVDPWLVGALIAMVVAKWAARVWSDMRG